MADEVFVGFPTQVDFSLLKRAEHPSEKSMFDAWKNHDLAQFYSEQHSNRRQSAFEFR